MFRILTVAATFAVFALFATMPAPVAEANGVDKCPCTKAVPKKRVRVVPPPRYDGRGHETNWMQRQGFTSCSQVRASCYRGANRPGHGLAYPGVCEDRYRTCVASGCWHTNNTGSRCGLARR
jgi:hypothetical protein